MKLIDADKIGLTDFEIIMCEGNYKAALEMILNQIDNAPTFELSKWISVSERLPEVGQNILLSSSNGMFTAEGWLKNDGDWYQFRWNTTWPSDYIDAWMPLPEPYKEKENETN